MELPDDECPPPEIWHHSERMEQWFEQLKERRRNPEQRPIEEFDGDDMIRNELVEELDLNG